MRGSRTVRCSAIALAALGAMVVPGSAAAEWLPSAPVGPSAAARPDLAMDARGDAVAVWQDGTAVAAASRPAGGTWSAPSTLDASGKEPSVALADDGTAIAAWTHTGAATSDDRAVTAVRAPAGSWTPAGTVTAPALPTSRAGDVAVTPEGDATLVFQSDDGTLGQRGAWAARRAPGGAWGTPVLLSAPGGFSDVPHLALAPDGPALASWLGSTTNINRAHTASRRADGTWEAATTLSPANGSVYDTAPAIGRDGTQAVAYVRSSGTTNGVYALAREPGAPWPVTPSPLDFGPDAAEPAVTVDATTGSATVVWSQIAGGAPPNATRVKVATRPAGGTWGLPPELDTSTAAVLSDPQVVTDAAGATTALWLRRTSTRFVIRSARRVPGSAFGLAEDRSQTTTFDGDVRTPRLAVDAGGDVLALWRETAGGLRAAPDDRAGPLLEDRTMPLTATTGVPVPLSVTVTDAFSKVQGVRWNLGDGTFANGASIVHTWTQANPHTLAGVAARDVLGNQSEDAFVVQVRSPAETPTTPTTPDDPDGPTTPTTPVPPVTTTSTPGPPPPPPTTTATGTTPTPPPARDTTRPTLSRLALRGRRVSVRVSEAARVTVLVQRCTTTRGRTRCVTRRTLTVRAATARTVSRTIPKAVRRGRYRLAVSATDAAGNRSATIRRTVRLAR